MGAKEPERVSSLTVMPKVSISFVARCRYVVDLGSAIACVECKAGGAGGVVDTQGCSRNSAIALVQNTDSQTPRRNNGGSQRSWRSSIDVQKVDHQVLDIVQEWSNGFPFPLVNELT